MSATAIALVDVREPGEFKAERIPGAINVALSMLKAQLEKSRGKWLPVLPLGRSLEDRAGPVHPEGSLGGRAHREANPRGMRRGCWFSSEQTAGFTSAGDPRARLRHLVGTIPTGRDRSALASAISPATRHARPHAGLRAGKRAFGGAPFTGQCRWDRLSPRCRRLSRSSAMIDGPTVSVGIPAERPQLVGFPRSSRSRRRSSVLSYATTSVSAVPTDRPALRRKACQTGAISATQVGPNF